MRSDLPFVLAAPEHPSLDGALGRFCDELGAETRRLWPLGPRGATSLIDRLATAGDGPRLAVAHDGAILGLGAIDAAAPCGPELLVAVAERWRRHGLAVALVRALVARAEAMGMERIVVHTNRPSQGIRALGAELGFQVVDLGQGRLDLLRTPRPVSRSA